MIENSNSRLSHVPYFYDWKQSAANCFLELREPFLFMSVDDENEAVLSCRYVYFFKDFREFIIEIRVP